MVMNSKIFEIGATILRAKAEADFYKNSLTFYFAKEKKDTISGILSESEVSFKIIEDDAIFVTGDNNIKTALDALVDGQLIEHDWMSEIITYFPAPAEGFQRLGGYSFFKSKFQKETELKQKNIETKLNNILETQCSFVKESSFNTASIHLPKDTTSEKLQKYADILKEANINVKIMLHKEQHFLKIDKKESSESISIKLESAINSNASYNF